jgi:glycosyltransferase involved in cell wall biosynthesis
MKIGMVSKFGAADGLCVRANQVLEGLLERGHDVHIFAQSYAGSNLPEDRVHRISAVHLNPHYSLDSPAAGRMIANESQRHGIEVLHIQMNSGSTEFLLPAFKKVIPPLVVTFHLAYASGASFYTTLFSVAWKASLFASKRYDQIVLVDPSQKPYFTDYGIPEDKLTVIRNGVDTELFSPRTNENDKDGIVDFVYVGRLSFDKGVDILLDAFKEYHRENPDTRLTLLGDGMLKSQLADCVKDGSVRWPGTIDHSCGLPVITTAIGETTKLLSEKEGILVKPNSTAAVVDAMRRLAEDRELRRSMGKRCREKVEKEYSWTTQLEQLEKVYERATS